MKYSLKGVNWKKLPFELIKKGDLIFFEGPVLSYFADEYGIDYLMRWTEMDEAANRWLLCRVTKDQVHKYLSGKVSLLSLIQQTESGVVYFLDIDEEVVYVNIRCVEVGDIPDGYLPDDNSCFDMKFATDYARELADEFKNLHKIQKKSDSFFDSAVVKLFGKELIDKNSSSIKELSTYKDNPDYFNGSYIHSLIGFPILLHLHANEINRIKYDLVNIISPSYINIIDELSSPQDWIKYRKSFTLKKIDSENIAVTIRRIFESTNHLIKYGGKEYLSLYLGWKKAAALSLDLMDIVDHYLEIQFINDSRSKINYRIKSADMAKPGDKIKIIQRVAKISDSTFLAKESPKYGVVIAKKVGLAGTFYAANDHSGLEIMGNNKTEPKNAKGKIVNRKKHSK